MKKIIITLAALLWAVPVFAQVTPSTLMGVGMPAQQAVEVVRMTQQQTNDGADNGLVSFTGGGAFAASRGGGLRCYGNEVATVGGACEMYAGNVSTGNLTFSVNNSSSNIIFSTGSGTVWSVSGNTGDLTSNASNGGGLIFSGSGDTISVQEATGATACMGVATPNGNTNVTVTTSCAVSGARVFYSRLGAITNMGTITTTTAPAGANFTFASTGATDTTAGSVVWLIVKESA
jgi:hypothetical protein